MNKDKLQKYAEHGFNVLLEGSHGLVKTAVIKEVFESLDLKWKYFSAATMDPWIDFIGVPKTVTRDNVDVLELIKPAEFANDEVEALFFDEFNRAPPKVMNAVMELIQFKSINGRKFNNLKLVWAAINPHDEDGTYSVEQLDPAVKDRFHIQIQIPLELDNSYLTRTHGDLAKPFIKWWNELPKELKQRISPRRLDYALQVYTAIGDMRNVLPADSNVKKLEEYIQEGTLGADLKKLESLTPTALSDFFSMENTIRYAEQVLKSKKHSKWAVYFHKDFVESVMQQKKGSALKTMLFEEALQNEELLNSLSKESRILVDKSRDTGVVQAGHVDYATEQALQKLLLEMTGRRLTWFMPRLHTIFNAHCVNLRKNKSTDIVSFFEALFQAKDPRGNDLSLNLMKALLDFKSPSAYFPQDKSEQITLGLLLNFAVKHRKAANLSVDDFKQVIDQLMAVHAKYAYRGNNGIHSYGYWILGFEEKNWEALKDAFEKKTDWVSVANTVKVRELMQFLKARTPASLKYSNVTSWSDAYRVFSTKAII